MVLGGLIVVIAIQSIISGHLVYALGYYSILKKGRNNFLTGILFSLADKSIWYVFIWLLPLGLVKSEIFSQATDIRLFWFGGNSLNIRSLE